MRLAEQNYTFSLAVARPDPAQGNAEEVERVNAALDAILAETESADRQLALKMTLVDPGQPADLRLAVLSDTDVAALSGDPREAAAAVDATPALWLMPASGADLAPAADAHTGAGPRRFRPRNQFRGDARQQSRHHLSRDRPVAPCGGEHLQAHGLHARVRGAAQGHERRRGSRSREHAGRQTGRLAAYRSEQQVGQADGPQRPLCRSLLCHHAAVQGASGGR